MKTRVANICLAALVSSLLSGCAAVELGMVGAGKSATAEDSGFFKSYTGLVATRDPAYRTLPDLYYVSPGARISAYTKVLVPDFTSLTADINKLGGLQVRQYKTIKRPTRLHR